MPRLAEAKSPPRECAVDSGQTVDDVIVAIECDWQMPDTGASLWI